MVVDEGLVLNVPPSSPSARRFFSTLATLSCTETAVRVATHPVVEALRETHGKYASVLRVWAPCRTGIMTRRNASRLEAAQAAEPGAGAGGEN